MIYKFKSPAAGDLIMLAPQGDQLLRLLGREPAPQGIFEPADMPALVRTLQAALEAAETPLAGARTDADTDSESDTDSDTESKGDSPAPAVGLRQRMWPMVDMLRRAQAAGARIVWGV